MASSSLRHRRGQAAALALWGATALAFAIYQSGGSLLRLRWPAIVCADPSGGLLICAAFWEKLLVAAAICGSGLAIHELAHRAARPAGAAPHLAIGPLSLALPVALALAGFFVVGPLVWWRSAGRPDAAGRAALAGPLANLGVSLLFFAGLSVIIVGRVAVPAWLPYVGYAGFRFHALQLLCSMAPVGRFDGAAVLRWNAGAWAAMLAAGVILTFVLGNEHVLQWLLQLVTGK